MAKYLGLVLPVQLGQNGYFQSTTELRTQAKTNIRNLLLTRLGERPMQPEFGSRIYEALFAPILQDTSSFIDADIRVRVAQWLPYITLTNVSVTTLPDENKISIQITYYVNVNSNFTDSITLVI